MDYVRLRMTGEHATDLADASGTLWAGNSVFELKYDSNPMVRDHVNLETLSLAC